MTASACSPRLRFCTLTSNLCLSKKVRSISRMASGTTQWNALRRSSLRIEPMSRRSASTASTCWHVNMIPRCFKRNSTSSRTHFAMLKAEILTSSSTFQESSPVSAAASPKCSKEHSNCLIWHLSYSLKMLDTKQRSATSTALRASMKPHTSHIRGLPRVMRPS